MIENSTYSTKSLKKRLLEENILENKCYNDKCICNTHNITKWICPDKKKVDLYLEMDHINGKHNDNRIDNLRILCKNCHSATDTFTGKNVKKKNIIALNVIINYLVKRKLVCVINVFVHLKVNVLH